MGPDPKWGRGQVMVGSRDRNLERKKKDVRLTLSFTPGGRVCIRHVSLFNWGGFRLFSEANVPPEYTSHACIICGAARVHKQREEEYTRLSSVSVCLSVSLSLSRSLAHSLTHTHTDTHTPTQCRQRIARTRQDTSELI